MQVILPEACPAIGAEAEHPGPSLLEPLVSGLELRLQVLVLLSERDDLLLELLVFFAKVAQLDQLFSKDAYVNFFLPWFLDTIVAVDDLVVLIKDAGLVFMLLGLPYILRLLSLLSMLSHSPSFLSLDLVPDVHPDEVVASLRDVNVFGET